MTAVARDNAYIAARLREAGDLLHAQGANPYRVGAYQRAAESVERHSGSLRDEFDRRGVQGLQRLPGVGVGIANAIAEMLITGHWRQLTRLRGEADEAGAAEAPHSKLPPVALILDVDREYRSRATQGALHAQRGEWHFTAQYSNTARAHELGRTRDWVVIYFYDGELREHLCTVVTENRGDLAGYRVVRGREAECRELIEQLQPA
jgi:hypothetical protein